MNILIVSATKNEVEPTLNYFQNIKQINEHIVHTTHKNGNRLYFLSTGVGMVSTTYHLTKFLSQIKIDLVINAGIAGAISNLNIGDVVNVVSDYFYELGAENNNDFIPLADMNLLTESDFPLNQKNIEIKCKFEESNLLKTIIKVNAITVNKVHGNTISIEQLLKFTQNANANSAYIESMEGASVAFVCIKSNVSCLQIRSISNRVEPRNRDNWNIPLAINKLNIFLINYPN